MNNKIYIIATAENKHLIIPYLESLGGKVHPVFNDGTFECRVGLKYFIDIDGYMDGADLSYKLVGYTEYKFPEQPLEGDSIAANVELGNRTFTIDTPLTSEIDILKKENEQLRELVKELVNTLENIEGTLFHHNHSIEGWHLNGDLEPIMNFVSDFNMDVIKQAKQLLK